MQEQCEIRLTRGDGLGSIRQLAKKIGRIAQLVERCPYKAEVTGSIPVPPTTEGMWIQAVSRNHKTTKHRPSAIYSLVDQVILYR